MYKKISITFLLLAPMVMNIGCESNAVRREEAFTRHSEWSEFDKKMIAEGMIYPGMTKDQVRAAWGQPCKECLGSKKFSSGVESWEFQTQVVIFDKAGKVTKWVER